jgi:hypothetical protein
MLNDRTLLTAQGVGLSDLIGAAPIIAGLQTRCDQPCKRRGQNQARYDHDGKPILLKRPLAKTDLKKAKTRSLSRPQITALLIGTELKLTRSSMGWSPDGGVTSFDGCFSPATISSLWERGLLDANFIDVRVIYGGRGLIDMKNFDGACHADAPGMPKFQVWTSALGKKVLQDKGLFSKNVELRYH